MSLKHCQFSTSIRRTAAEVFEWHERPGALERLTPPWEKITITRNSPGLRDGDRLSLIQKVGPISLRWEVEHRGYVKNREFTDVALRGPFSYWEHHHQFVPDGPGTCRLIDSVRYKLPFGAVGGLVAGGWTETELRRLFAFRQRRLAEDLESSARYGAIRPMRFLISGASGFIGAALIPFLLSQGHEVVKLVRRPSLAPDEVAWNPELGQLDHRHLREIDVVINLAGASVARRWSKQVRDEIWRSRVDSTRTLVGAVAHLRQRPFVFISASAIGFYGSCGEKELDESSERGGGFLAEVCDAWEKETQSVEELGIRAVSMRTGIVLSPQGGALASLLPAFRAGVGGPVGKGRQWMSWISIDDLVGAFYHAVLDRRCAGAVNTTGPTPVTNETFSQVLAGVLKKPCFVRVPAPLLRLGFGDMADEALLSSARVRPKRLVEAGYEFRHIDLADTLSFLLGRNRRPDREA